MAIPSRPDPSTPLSDARARLDDLLESATPALQARVGDALAALEPSARDEVGRALVEVVDLEPRTVRDVLGRDGNPVPVHHFEACRAEDPEASWDFRPPSPAVRRLRDALMGGLLGARGMYVEGADGVARAAQAGKRLLFVSNHESVFDLAVLPAALGGWGLSELSQRLTFFVNPKIFNTPFINLFICKPLGLIKVPQNPRIAANESVMAADEIQRRAAHGFGVAGRRLAAGDSLVIYPEGLRSEGLLHRFARAYLDLLRPEALARQGLAPDDVLLVPWAHRGVRDLERLGDGAADVSIRFGPPVEPSRFFEATADQPPGVAAHLVGFLVARLLPEEQRGLYGADPEAYLGHPHYRLRIREHTLVDIQAAHRLLSQGNFDPALGGRD